MTTPDPGLQPERTLLAWRRTALALAANGVLLLASGHGTSPVRTSVGIAIIAVAFSTWTIVGLVYRYAEGQVTTLSGTPLQLATASLILAVGLFDLYAVLNH
ncbi:DUF202 domain-containing protein [Kribbella sp. CA-294648]|uniref:DUF202 domain-containing protein n=1 Tax=Kribbella sp. CA-294648 TaxID=3239948 RepID=UPI003D9221A8